MDRISYLPQSILHHILLRVPRKDVVRTSVLSKAWHDTWSTFPFLDFDESRYQYFKIPEDADIQLRKEVLLWNKYKFSIWVSRVLSSFHCKGLTIRTFKLIFKSLPPLDILSLVNHCMKLACDSSVEVLQLDNGAEKLQLDNPISYDLYDDFTCLPLCVLEAKSLIKLDLSWYFRVDQAFLNHPIKFSSLKVLSLSHVYLGDGQVIQKIISSCPLIEKFELDCCCGLKSVSIHGLTKLKVVYIEGIEEVDVDAPSLKNLSYNVAGFKTGIPCKINMDKCTNIQELCLVYFTYQGDGSILPSISILNSSSQLVLDITFFVHFLLDLQCLRTFLEDISPKHIPVSLFIGFREDSTVEFDPFELQDYLMVPPSIKHMTLCADSDTKEWSFLLVTNLFWCCRPSIISFDLDANKTLVKIFCEKLLCQKEDDCCCSSSRIKCWWHFLKDVKVSSSYRNHNAADDLKAFLEPFPTLTSEEEEISRFKEVHIQFCLEWQL